MPKMLFTDRGIKALKPANAPVDYWSTDPKERGFGLRVWPGGSKSWFVFTRKTRDGRAKRITLGTYPDKGLSEARQAAGDERARVRGGADPAAERRAERTARRETVRKLFEAYEQHVAVRRQAGEFRSWPEVKRALTRDVLAVWGDRPAGEIQRRDVIELVTAKATTGRTAANRLQAYLSMFFAFAVEADRLPANPAAGLRKRPERAHDRVLTPDEVKALSAYLAGHARLELSRGTNTTKRTMPESTAATLRDVFKVLVLTGQRLGETSRMRWADVDLDARVWTIPATETKNRAAHRVPLSRQVLSILKGRQETAKADDVFVFPAGPGAQGSALIWSKRTASAIATAIGVPFTAHDLRRSVASGLGELGVSTDTIGLVLNHRKPGVTARHYDLSRRETAKRDALQQWADHVDAIVSGKAGKVIPMRRGRR